MKISRAATLVALVLPMSLAAQQPGGAPNTAGGPLTTMFRNATMGRQRNLAQAFDSIPESLFSYKPTPAQQTIGFIAQHLANDNYLFCNAFGDKKGTRSAEETSTPDSVKATWPKARLVEQLKASFAFCEEAFTQLDDAKLVEQAQMAGMGGQMRQVLRAQMVMGHVTDMADHYSQISNYMRLNKMLPPTALPRPPRP
jgi:uncharacterized damage-inducible protein DinB